MALTNGNDIALKVGFDLDRFQSELNKTNGMLAGWGNGIRNQLLGAFSITGGVYLLKQGISDAVRTLSEFEKSMSEVKAITGAVGKDFNDLKNNALNLSGAFKAIDISKLETEFGRLGFSTQEILDSTKATIALASATGSDLATSATIAGSTLRAFGLEAKEMGRVTDVMAGGLNRSGLDMSNFAEAIKYVAPSARAANISLEETVAMLGILADNGIKGSLAGTGLSRMITDLDKEARPLSERLKELQARGMNAADAMEEIGRIGAKSLLILANNADKTEILGKELKLTAGEAEAMSKIMQDNLIGDWNKFNAQVDKTILNQGALNTALRTWVQGFTELAKISWSGIGNGLAIFTQGISAAANLKRNHTDGSVSGPNPEVFEDPLAGLHGKTYQPFKTDKVQSSDPLRNIMFKGQYQGELSDTMKNLAKDAGYASDAFKNMWQEVDMTNDGLKLMSKEAEPGVTATTDGLINGLNAAREHAEKFDLSWRRIVNTIRSSVIGAFSALGQAIGNMGNKSFNFGATLLQGIGNMAIQLGELAIGIGIGIESIKKAFESLNGIAAIAAGVALVALGSFATSQAAAIGSSGVSGSSSSGGARAFDNVRAQPIALTLNGQFTAKGSDMALVLSKNNYNVSRVGG